MSCAPLFTSAAAAQDPSDRVARISVAEGAVSWRPQNVTEWSVATVNYPLTAGDDLWTDSGSRTELQLGTAAVRVAPRTELSVLALDDRAVQLRLAQGALLLRVRTLDSDDRLEIDTPAGAVTLVRPGVYRVDVNDTGDAAIVTVRQGEANVAMNTVETPLVTNQSVMIAARDTAPPAIQPAIRIDDFETWSLARDRRGERLEAARYVSPDTIGYEDLDANGSWQTAPEYGPVWVPRVSAGWAPYRFGHWAFVEPWGWTWIDDTAWGFAPFHYGRWAMLPGRGWVWVPGRVVARPVYAPALVAFVGGPGWSASVGVGGAPVGWFPLGPREVYVPAYRVTPVYVQRVNAPHVVTVNVNVTNVVYVNRGVPNAVTVVSHDTFVHARPVAHAIIAVPHERIGAAAVVGTAPPQVAPQPASIVGETAARAVPPPAAVSRQVIVRRVPQAPAARVAPAQAARPAMPPPAAAPPATAPPAAVPPAPSPNAAAPRRAADPDVAARHAQERSQLEARHQQERAALQAKHQQERQAVPAAERAAVQQRHQQELKALQDRQRQEREAVHERQQAERARKEKS